MKKILPSIVIASLVGALSMPVMAHDHGVKSEKQANAVVKFRKSVLQLVKSNMGPLGAMAKKEKPYDAAVMEKNAMRIEQLGLMMEDYFTPDTRAFKVETEAKSKIWDNFDDFTSKADDMVSAAKALQVVASNKDADQYRKAIGKLGSTCKACHDDYKED